MHLHNVHVCISILVCLFVCVTVCMYRKHLVIYTYTHIHNVYHVSVHIFCVVCDKWQKIRDQCVTNSHPGSGGEE